MIDIAPLRAAGVPPEVSDVVVRRWAGILYFVPRRLGTSCSRFGRRSMHAAFTPRRAMRWRCWSGKRAAASRGSARGSQADACRRGESNRFRACRAQRGSRAAIETPAAISAALPAPVHSSEKETPLPAASTPLQFCGKCAYCIQGLHAFTCPECGSDLRLVGRSTPSRRRYWVLAAYVVGWTVASYLLTGAFFIGLQTWVLPYMHPYAHEQHLERMIWSWRKHPAGTPLSQTWSQDTVLVKQDGHQLVWGRHRHVIPPVSEMTFEDNRTTGAIAPMHVDLVTGAYRFTDASGKIVTASSGFGKCLASMDGR